MRRMFASMLPRPLTVPAMVVFAVLATLTAIAVILLFTGLLQPRGAWAAADVCGLINATAAAAVFTATGLSRSGPERRWRVHMAVGLTGWACAQGLWSWHRVVQGRAMTFPDFENFLFWILPIGVFAALVVIARSDHATSRTYDAAAPARVLVLDMLVIVTSLALLAWQLVANSLPERAEWEIILLTISYAVGDLVLIVLTILMAVALHSMWRPRLAWLMAGLIAIGASDILYTDVIVAQKLGTHITDLGYMIGPLLLLPAALTPPRPGVGRRHNAPLVLLALPYVPLALVCSLVVLDATQGQVHPVEIYLLTATVVLVVVRHLATLQQLYRAHGWLSHRALHDPLTGAANRTLLSELLDSVVIENPVTRPGLIYVDLNEFKTINDTLGHHAGDVLLRVVSDRLRRCVRGNDTVARIGGDEFVLLLNPRPPRPDELLERVATTVEAPIDVPGAPEPVVVTASLGYHAIEPQQSVSEALAEADRAMYDNKRSGS